MTKVLVTGATGNVGSRVVKELAGRGVPVRAFVRDPDRAAAALGPEVELAVGDLADPASIQAALEGVERVFLACGNLPPQVAYETNLIDAAARLGCAGWSSCPPSGPGSGRRSTSGTGTPGSRSTWAPRGSLRSSCARATT